MIGGLKGRAVDAAFQRPSTPGRLKLVFASNSAWVVPAGADERRYCVIDVPPITKNKRRRRDKAA